VEAPGLPEVDNVCAGLVCVDVREVPEGDVPKKSMVLWKRERDSVVDVFVMVKTMSK
jgi:hypothetical protein